MTPISTVKAVNAILAKGSMGQANGISISARGLHKLMGVTEVFESWFDKKRLHHELKRGGGIVEHIHPASNGAPEWKDFLLSVKMAIKFIQHSDVAANRESLAYLKSLNTARDCLALPTLGAIIDQLKIGRAVIGRREVYTVDGRGLWALLGAKAGYQAWLKKHIKSYGFSINVDYTQYYKDVTGKPGERRRENMLCTDMAIELCKAEPKHRGDKIHWYIEECIGMKEQLRKKEDGIVILVEPLPEPIIEPVAPEVCAEVVPEPIPEPVVPDVCAEVTPEVVQDEIALIPITPNVIGDTEVRSVNARELHEFLGSKRQYSNWITDRIEKYNFVEGLDFSSLNEIVKRIKGATTITEYFITLDMAKELSMVEKTPKGKEARQYFIKWEKIGRGEIKKPSSTLSIPDFSNPLEAAEAFSGVVSKLAEIAHQHVGVLKSNVDLTDKLAYAIKSKYYISDTKTATAMSTAGVLTKKVKALEKKLKEVQEENAK